MNEFETITQKDCLVLLDDYGLIKVSGADAQNFLHGQFTNDLKQGVNETSSQLSGYCNPKGRLLALFRVFMHQGDYYLIMPRPVIEATLKRLRMFVLMSKVTLEDVSDAIHQLGVSGLKSPDVLKQVMSELPDTMDHVSHNGNISVICLHGGEPRFLLIGPAEEIEVLREKLVSELETVSPAAWELLDIHSGQPVVRIENVEAFVPQMINLQAVNGLNFKKGCYPGQEVVARMQYLGKLKRRMYQAHCDLETAPKPGDEIFCAEPETRKAGTVVIAQPAAGGGTDLLMVTEIEATDSQALYADQALQAPLTLKELPYAFDA